VVLWPLLAAFLLVAGTARHLILLVAAIVLTDLGNRVGLISNQTRIYALSTEARSRLNTVFMTSYFLGGAAGAGVAAFATEHFGWLGLSITGIGFAVLALVAHFGAEHRALGMNFRTGLAERRHGADANGATGPKVCLRGRIWAAPKPLAVSLFLWPRARG
jgi:MFS family permease